MLDVGQPAAEANMSSWRWTLSLRGAASGWPTFVFFPHAGGSVLSAGRLVAALPPSAGAVAVNLPRGGNLDDGSPPRRVAEAVHGITQGFLATAPAAAPGPDGPEPAYVLVGNSYGALLAYETAWSLARHAVPVSRLIISGFRAPILASPEAPLHRLPAERLMAELTARFGSVSPNGVGELALVGPALRADLEACDTYRHAHSSRLPVPIDVLHLRQDPSVSVSDLSAWQTVTTHPLRITPHDAGHFPWATHPDDLAHILLGLAESTHRCTADHDFPSIAASIQERD